MSAGSVTFTTVGQMSGQVPSGPVTLIHIVLSKYRLELLDKRSLGSPESLNKLLELKDRPIEIRSLPQNLDTQNLLDEEEGAFEESFSGRSAKSSAHYDLDVEQRDKTDIYKFGQAVAQHKQQSGQVGESDVRGLEDFQRLNKDVLGALWTQQYSFTLREKSHPGDSLVFHCDSILIYKQLEDAPGSSNRVDLRELESENRLKLIEWVTQLTQERLLVDQIDLLGQTIRTHREIQQMAMSVSQEPIYALLLRFINGDFATFVDSLNKMALGISQGICLNNLTGWHSKYCN